MRHIPGVINPPDNLSKPLGWVLFLAMLVAWWDTMLPRMGPLLSPRSLWHLVDNKCFSYLEGFRLHNLTYHLQRGRLHMRVPNLQMMTGNFCPGPTLLIQSRSGFYNAAAHSCIGGGCWATIYKDTLHRIWRDTLFQQAEDRRSIEECRDNTT